MELKTLFGFQAWRTENIEEVGWSDDTDTHIDTIARFVNPTTIVYAWSDSFYDRVHPILKRNYKALKEAVLASGKHPDLVALPIPKHGYYSTSKVGAGGFIMEFNHAVRTDASYTNFLISNNIVIVPIFGNINDEKAMRILGELFPSRNIVGVNYGTLAENGGEIHCTSQQQPEGRVGYIK